MWKLGIYEGKGLFQLCMTPMMPKETNAAKGNNTSYLWHLKLGHIGFKCLIENVKKNSWTGIDMKSANR